MAYIKHLVDLDLNKNQLLNTKLQNLGAHPTVVVGTDEGFVYWNTVDDTAYVYTGVGTVWLDLGSSGITNLDYIAAASQGTVTSDTGDNAVIPLADGTNAGLMSAAEKAKLGGIDPGATDDQTASEVPSTPLGNLTSTNVQSALNELQADIDANTTSNSGSVTVHSDVTNAGSGAIITSVERTKLNGIEALADVTDTANVTTAGALMDSEVTDLTGIKAVTISTLQVKPSEGAFVNGDKTKLDGIEALADVTDAANVNAAGAVMNTDATTVAMSFVIDEDNMVSDSATKVPTQQSVKAYVDTEVGAVVPNSPTALSTGTVSSTTYGITSDGSANDVILAAATTSLSGVMTGADKTKLGGIEALADVTDATNVNAAGAVMNSDTTTASMSFVIDEDAMGSNSSTKVPTQQSVKAYVDANLAANDAMIFKGTIGTGGTLTLAAFNALVVYDAGWSYKVITAGTYKGVVSEIGDMFIATVDRASGGVNSDWTVVQANLDGAVIGPASAGSGNVATFDGTSGKLIQDSGLTLTGSNTGDEPNASTTVRGIIEIATIAETNTGTDTVRAVSPDGLDGWTGSAQVTTVGTIAAGTWQGTAINQTYLVGQSGTNTGDEPTASTTVAGIVELATNTEANTGTATNRALTPANLKNVLGTTTTLSTTLTYSTLIGDGILTSISVAHGIGNQFVQANVYEVADGMGLVECEIELTSASVTTFKFNVAPASGALRVVIIG